jgi:hypothetical protein
MQVGDIVKINKSDDWGHISDYYVYGDLAIIVSKFLNSHYFDVYITHKKKHIFTKHTWRC